MRTYLVSYNVTDDVFEPVAVGVQWEDAAAIVGVKTQGYAREKVDATGEIHFGRYHITDAPEGCDRWVNKPHLIFNRIKGVE